MGKKAKEQRLMKRKKVQYNFFDVFVITFCTLYSLLCIYPIWYVLVVSITPYQEFINKTVVFWPPMRPDFQYYQAIFSSQVFQNSILISVFKTVVSTALTISVTSAMAYGVSKSKIKGMKVINVMVVCTLYFSGGLIPTFMLYRDLSMLKTMLPMIIPGALHATYFIIMRNYFAYTVPPDLEEAAEIDGSNAIITFFRIILPLSIPMVAAISLFVGVAEWNDYYSFLMYVNVPRLQPYVWILRRMLVDQSFSSNISANAELALGVPIIPAFSLRMATIITAMLPIMIVYPFIQKHFAKGILIGAVKG